MLQYLLEQGANFNETDIHGKTPLQLATEIGN